MYKIFKIHYPFDRFYFIKNRLIHILDDEVILEHYGNDNEARMIKDIEAMLLFYGKNYKKIYFDNNFGSRYIIEY